MPIPRAIAIVAVALAGTACGAWRGGARYAPATPTEDQRLARFLDETLQTRLDRDPELATRTGDRRKRDAWTDRSLRAAEEARDQHAHELDRLRTDFDRGDLELESRIHYRAFELLLERELASMRWRAHAQVLPPAIRIGEEVERFLLEEHPLASVDDVEAWIARVRGLRALFAQVIENVRDAAGQAILPSRAAVDAALAHCREMRGPLGRAALAARVERALDELELDAARRESLLGAARAALEQECAGAFRSLEAGLAAVAASALPDGALWRLPEGGAYYTYRIGCATGGGHAPQDLHRLGLAEVDRLEDELRGSMERAAVGDSLDAFLERMRASPSGYATDDEAGRALLLERIASYLAAIEMRLDEIVAESRRSELEVRARAPGDPRFHAETLLSPRLFDQRDLAVWVVDVARPELLPLASLEALTYRRALPGEHLARATARRERALPRLFLLDPEPAALEGWCAYAEWVPRELGFYEDLASDFGRQLAALSRAARLVADTGVHARRWSPARAREYLLEHTADSEAACDAAIESILTDPGATASAVVGGQKLVELRARAQRRLTAAFDLREFHAVVLRTGPLPLPALEERVDAWIAAEMP